MESAPAAKLPNAKADTASGEFLETEFYSPTVAEFI